MHVSVRDVPVASRTVTFGASPTKTSGASPCPFVPVGDTDADTPQVRRSDERDGRLSGTAQVRGSCCNRPDLTRRHGERLGRDAGDAPTELRERWLLFCDRPRPSHSLTIVAANL
jgi:hypothetical protein